MNTFRCVQKYLYVSDNDKHEPAESDAGVHVAEQLVAFPKLYMEKTVAEPVLDILGHYLRIDQRKEKSFSVLMAQLEYHS